jgi:hypothetical protein
MIQKHLQRCQMSRTIPCFEDALLDLFVRFDALRCLEYAIITWPRVVYMINFRGDSLLVCICRQAILEWGNNHTRWHVRRIIKICNLIAERRRASDLFLMRTLSYAYANPHTRAFGSYLIDMGYAPTTVVNGTLSQYLHSEYKRRQRTLPVLRAVRLTLLAILRKRTWLPKDVARLVVKNEVLWQPDTWRRWE